MTRISKPPAMKNIIPSFHHSDDEDSICGDLSRRQFVGAAGMALVFGAYEALEAEPLAQSMVGPKPTNSKYALKVLPVQGEPKMNEAHLPLNESVFIVD